MLNIWWMFPQTHICSGLFYYHIERRRMLSSGIFCLTILRQKWAKRVLFLSGWVFRRGKILFISPACGVWAALTVEERPNPSIWMSVFLFGDPFFWEVEISIWLPLGGSTSGFPSAAGSIIESIICYCCLLSGRERKSGIFNAIVDGGNVMIAESMFIFIWEFFLFIFSEIWNSVLLFNQPTIWKSKQKKSTNTSASREIINSIHWIEIALFIHLFRCSFHHFQTIINHWLRPFSSALSTPKNHLINQKAGFYCA